MFQTGYNGVQGLSTRLPFTGGFCEWYYTPKENIASIPAIDPVTQYLNGEPTLIDGATWYLIKVPNDQLGFEEVQAIGKGGIYYKQTVKGFHAGDGGNSRVNLENMPYHEFVIVGRLRAGGMYLLIGDQVNGFTFAQDFSTSSSKYAGTQFSFENTSLYKGLILTSFLGQNVTPPPDYISSSSNNGSGSEIIFFNTETEVPIVWTEARKGKFGVFPTIQVWTLGADGKPELGSVAITCDAQPPDETLFVVYTPGTPGFIVID